MIFSTLVWTNLLWSCLSLKDGEKNPIFDVYGMTGVSARWRPPCQERSEVVSVYQSNNTGGFEFIGRIPQKIIFNSSINFISTKDTVSFPRDQEYDYVSVGFNDSFYCGSVKYFSMYYYNCPDGTNELIEFPRETAPNDLSSPK